MTDSDKTKDSDNTERLPEVFQASMSKDQVMQLFADLSNGAQIRHVMIRRTAHHAADRAVQDVVVPLDQARQHFADGLVSRIQVRYQFGSQMWCDTLMANDPLTTQLIRTRDPSDGMS